MAKAEPKSEEIPKVSPQQTANLIQKQKHGELKTSGLVQIQL